MNPNERISKIIEYSGLSSSEFADEVDVQRSSISHITSGRNKPSLDFLIKVKERFPELQWDWLIKGEGEMLINKETEEETAGKEEKPKPTSLPDLFSLIDDDNFGYTESEDRIQKEMQQNIQIQNSRESVSSALHSEKENIRDSQRSETQNEVASIQNTDSQQNKIKRIVLFYENGKFESFEP